jgi:hypothetical protein
MGYSLGPAALTISILTGAVSSAEAQDATLVIRVYDEVGLGSETTNRTLPRLEAIFRAAGIRIEWRDCRTQDLHLARCAGAPLPHEAVARFLPGPSTVSAHGCGAALLPNSATAHYVTIFLGCLNNAAEALGVGADVVFAGTLAHEIGHLLLGRAHRSVGLMQARPRSIDWRRAAHNGLLFTEAESQRLRAALIARRGT